MIHDDFRMHRAGVFLFLLLLARRAVAKRRRVLVIVILLGVRAIGINRPYLRTCCECDQRNCARDQS